MCTGVHACTCSGNWYMFVITRSEYDDTNQLYILQGLVMSLEMIMAGPDSKIHTPTLSNASNYLLKFIERKEGTNIVLFDLENPGQVEGRAGDVHVCILTAPVHANFCLHFLQTHRDKILISFLTNTILYYGRWLHL